MAESAQPMGLVRSSTRRVQPSGGQPALPQSSGSPVAIPQSMGPMGSYTAPGVLQSQRPDVYNQLQGQYKSHTNSSAWGLSQNRAYDNVARNDGMGGTLTRAHVASRFDPQSWVNASYSPRQRQDMQTAQTNQLLASIRSGPDRTGARTQYQYSPVYGAGVYQGLNNQSAQNQANDLAQFRYGLAQRNQRVMENPQTATRMAAMTGTDGPYSPTDYLGRLATATNQYNQYARGARSAGVNPMGFETFLSQMQPGAMTPEVQQLMNSGRASMQMQRQMPPSQPNIQASQFLNSRFGIPMQTPRDPVVAQQWQNTLASQGNPYAMAMNSQAQAQAAQLLQTQMEQRGQTDRAQLQYGPRPAQSLTPMETQQMIAGAMAVHPVTVGNQMANEELKKMQAMGYTPEQMRAAEPEIQKAYQRGYNMALPQYSAIASRMPEYYPPIQQGDAQYGIPAPGSPVQGAQTTTSAPAAPGSPVPGYVSPVGGVLSVPSLDKPDALQYTEATPAEVARLIEQNPNATPEMIEATLASLGKRMPKDPATMYSANNTAPNPNAAWGLGGNRQADPRDQGARARASTAANWLDRNRERYGVPSQQEMQDAIQKARREIPVEYGF